MVSESVFPTMKSQGAAKNEANNAAQSGAAAPAETKVAEKVDFSNVKIEPIFEEMVDFDTFAKSDFRAVKILECEAVPKSKKLLKFVLDDGERKDRVILSGIHQSSVFPLPILSSTAHPFPFYGAGL